MCLTVEVIGTAPIERVDVLCGMRLMDSVRPYTTGDLGSRIRVLWEGAEYRGRGRETLWQGRLTVSDNRIARVEAVNFLNPERKVREVKLGLELAWNSVSTGNRAGIDVWLEDPRRGKLSIETNIVAGEVALTGLGDDTVTFDAGGLGRKLSVYRLPEVEWPRRLKFERVVARPTGPADLPVYVRVSQADGHQAWSSPIYLID